MMQHKNVRPIEKEWKDKITITFTIKLTDKNQNDICWSMSPTKPYRRCRFHVLEFTIYPRRPTFIADR
jgi:hypothetical protein